MPSEIDWIEKAASVRLPARHLVGGDWVDPLADDTFDVISPRDGALLKRVPHGDAHDVDRAVASARAAFNDRRWSGMRPAARGAVLRRWAELVQEHAEDLALTISLEMGKPVREAKNVELRAVANCLRWYGEIADKRPDESPAAGDDVLALITREPAGVVAAVVPWNFPLTMTAWKLGPSLVAGNSVVLKPAEQTPFSALKLAELGLEAGLPAGVLNVVPGRGDVVGQALGRHMDVDVVTFTGSPAVGRAFLRYSGESNGKRVWPELGGKSASVILPGADIEKAARASAAGSFYNQGQMCSASSRVVVHRDIADEVLHFARLQAREMAPADPLLHDAPSGALVSEQHLQRVLGYVRTAVEEGAELLEGSTGRHSVDGHPNGSYVAPTVLGGVKPGMTIEQEEVFGPVLSVITVDSEEEAIRVANGTQYGLAASVWTRDLSAATRVSRRMQAGIVWVNCFEEGDMTVPFGGVKGSGFGRDKSAHAIDKFTDLKTIWMEVEP
ncbi:aldehyde dehydrogenase [Ruicaihuangia caeni]|uniref:Aldehyde dehydrogenase n=1 Tax=Ruicaihuangia caeni TaxID=3042517 RepID=A0AAW6T951_9MICO|nr:aldehyde dehydrogenase [Klugiella sp. YN-L-19]MDI2099311.1 aldehyde dehydrogenase [Klugiella sp. YN-L-19]